MNKRKARKIILRNSIPGTQWEFACAGGKEFNLFIKAIRKLKPEIEFLGEGRIMKVLNPHETLKR